MPATWYKIEKYGTRITSREVKRETEAFLFFAGGRKEIRQAKVTNYDQWFPTREQAAAALRDRLESDLHIARDRLARATADLQTFELEHGPAVPQ